ncbi:hypothetical protein T45_00689 [Streptomyces turgidiscabies]|nr:hypothetical protein T45_00689 [Streptomyces turgidiscabies]
MSTQPKKTLDFAQIQSGKFNPIRKEEGEYLGVITSFEETNLKGGGPTWLFGVTLREDLSAVYPVYCLLGPDKLWKLRNLLVATGFPAPKKRVEIKGGDLLGKDIGVYLEDDEYEDGKKSVIGSFFPASEYEERTTPWPLCGLCGDVNPREEFIKPGEVGYDPNRATCGVCRTVFPDLARDTLTKLIEAWNAWAKTVRELRDHTTQMNDETVNVWDSGFFLPLLSAHKDRAQIQRAVNLALQYANSERLRAEAEGQ